MSAAKPDYNALIDAIPERKFSPLLTILTNAGMCFGVCAFAYGWFMFNPAWALGALLVGIVYFMAIAQGGLMFSVMLTGTWGRWGRPLKRIAESFVFFLPVVYLVLLVFLSFGTVMYPWHPETILPIGTTDLKPHSDAAWASKELWLGKKFLISRQVIGFAVLIWIDYLYIKASLRPDLIMAKQRLGDKAPAWWDRFIASPGDLDTEIDENFRSSINIVPARHLGVCVRIYAHGHGLTDVPIPVVVRKYVPRVGIYVERMALVCSVGLCLNVYARLARAPAYCYANGHT